MLGSLIIDNVKLKQNFDIAIEKSSQIDPSSQIAVNPQEDKNNAGTIFHTTYFSTT